MFLEQINVLNVEAREMVIDRVMDLEETSLTLDDLKDGFLIGNALRGLLQAKLL